MKNFCRIILVGVLFFFANNVQSQVVYDADPTPYGGLTREARIEIAAESIKVIKEGVLIVRLTSNAKKIKEIDRLLESPDVSIDKKVRLENMRGHAVAEAVEINKHLFNNFTEDFDFCEVLFMYDTSTYNLTDGLKKGYFLDKDLKVNPEISLGERSYRIVRYGILDHTLIRAPQLVVMDTNYRDLPDPFPMSYLPSSEFFRFFLVQVDSRRYINKRVGIFENSLEQFYGKCLARGWLSD